MDSREIHKPKFEAPKPFLKIQKLETRQIVYEKETKITKSKEPKK